MHMRDRCGSCRQWTARNLVVDLKRAGQSDDFAASANCPGLGQYLVMARILDGEESHTRPHLCALVTDL